MNCHDCELPIFGYGLWRQAFLCEWCWDCHERLLSMIDSNVNVRKNLALCIMVIEKKMIAKEAMRRIDERDYEGLEACEESDS